MVVDSGTAVVHSGTLVSCNELFKTTKNRIARSRPPPEESYDKMRCEIVTILTGKYKVKLLEGPMKGMVVARDCKQVTPFLQETPKETPREGGADDAAATGAAKDGAAAEVAEGVDGWEDGDNIFGDNDDVK